MWREATATSWWAIPPETSVSAAATSRLTAMKLSGVTEIESMPHPTRNRAKAGWSLGA